MDDGWKQRGTVMLVDDEPIVRKLLGRYLARDGYRVIAAADAEQALELAGDHAGTVDVLVTDVVLPGLDGRALSARMREANPSLRVVFVSGYVHPEQRLAQPGSTVLEKPFDGAALCAAIDGLA